MDNLFLEIFIFYIYYINISLHSIIISFNGLQEEKLKKLNYLTMYRGILFLN